MADRVGDTALGGELQINLRPFNEVEERSRFISAGDLMPGVRLVLQVEERIGGPPRIRSPSMPSGAGH